MPLHSSAAAFLEIQTTQLSPAALPPGLECPICLEPYDCAYPADVPLRINDVRGCNHAFGHTCLIKILEDKPDQEKKCPVCRALWIPASAPVQGQGSNPGSRPNQLLNVMSNVDSRRTRVRVGNEVTAIRRGRRPGETIVIDTDSENEITPESFAQFNRDIASIRARARNNQLTKRQRREQAVRGTANRSGDEANQAVGGNNETNALADNSVNPNGRPDSVATPESFAQFNRDIADKLSRRQRCEEAKRAATRGVDDEATETPGGRTGALTDDGGAFVNGRQFSRSEPYVPTLPAPVVPTESAAPAGLAAWPQQQNTTPIIPPNPFQRPSSRNPYRALTQSRSPDPICSPPTLSDSPRPDVRLEDSAARSQELQLREERLNTLKRALKTREIEVGMKERRFQAHERALFQREQRVAQREQRVAQREQRVAQREQRVSQREQKAERCVAIRNGQLEEMEQMVAKHRADLRRV